MTDEILTALLAAISAREHTIERAGEWTIAGVTIDDTLVVFDPDAEMRLCRAHRAIVEDYRAAAARRYLRTPGQVDGLGEALMRLAHAYDIEETS